MLWDSVFEFYIKHIFGGVIGGVSYAGNLGTWYRLDGNTYQERFTSNYIANFLQSGTGIDMAIPLGNYLSMIATIITMVFILVLCCLFVYKIIKLIGGLIR